MAQCVGINNNGNLSVINTTIENCLDYVLISRSEFGDLPTLQNIFTVPLVEDLQQIWMIGFEIPIIVYLVSWAYQTVINFCQSDNY